MGLFKKLVSVAVAGTMVLSMGATSFAAQTFTPKFYKEGSTTQLSMANDVFDGQAIVNGNTVKIPIKSFYVKKLFVTGNGAMTKLDIHGVNEKCKIQYIPEDIDSNGNIIMSKDDPAKGTMLIDFQNAPGALDKLTSGAMASDLEYQLSITSGKHKHVNSTVNFSLEK